MTQQAIEPRHLVSYAEAILGNLGRDAGMDKRRKREYLHACLEKWEAAYGRPIREAVEAAIRAKWRAA